MDQPVRVALESLVEHLKSEGYPADLQQDHAYPGIANFAVAAEAVQLEEQDGIHVACLFVALFPDAREKEYIGDLATGFGKTQEEALQAAMVGWSGSILPVVETALVKDFVHPSVEVWGPKTALGIEGWKIIASAYQARGAAANRLADTFTQQPPFEVLRSELSGHLRPGSRHWLKLVVNRLDGRREHDCYLDNENWDAGTQALEQWAFPPEAGDASFWQFLLLLAE